jgi:uncharacterized damage-inducible protein DinB
MRTQDLLQRWSEVVFWADWQFVDCVESLTPEQQQQDATYSIGSVIDHLAHLVRVEYWWFHFLQSGEYHFLRDSQYDTLDAIKQSMHETHANIRKFLETVKDERLTETVKPEWWLPETKPITVAEAVIQVFNHSTDHRAQALQIIHQLGGNTFQQDYIFRERPEIQD